MEGKYEKQKKQRLLQTFFVCSIFVLGVVFGLVLSKVYVEYDNHAEKDVIIKSEEVASQQEETILGYVPSDVVENLITIDTAVCPLQISETYQEYIQHVEVSQDEDTMEIFYMIWENFEIELFRVCFFTDKTETDIGWLETAGGSRYVSIEVCNYSDDDFLDQEMREIYTSLIGNVETVLSSIQTNTQFHYKGEVEIQRESRNIRYWNVTIPEMIDCEEASTDTEYSVVFFGNVNNERIKLFALCWGEKKLGTELGYFTADGVSHPISVESYDLPDTTGWRDEDVTQLYTMISSINIVIQEIESSEGYCKEMPLQ